MTAGGPTGGRPPGRRTAFLDIFPKVSLPMFLALSDQSIVATALPTIAGSLDAAGQISLVVIGYLVAATVSAPAYGRLGDSFGRRRLLLFALGIFMAASMVCMAAPSLPVLVAGRVLQGVGGGGLMALSQALLGEALEPRERARYQGYFATVGVTSNALGPVLGGLLTEHFGWRSIFLFQLPVSLLALWVIARLPRRAPEGEPFRFDYAGLVLFAVFVVSTLYLLQLVQRVALDSLPLMALLLAVSATSLFLLVSVERRRALPLLPLDLLRDPTVWRANALAGCHGAILISLLSFVPIFLRVAHGTSAAATGLLLVPMTVGIGVGSFITGQMVSRTGRTAVFPSWGLLCVATGLAAIALCLEQLAAGEVSAALGVMALFLGTIMSVVQVTVQMAAGRARLGAAAAAVQYSRTLGAAFGTALVAAVLFATLARVDPEAGRLFGIVLQEGPGALDQLAPERAGQAREAFAQAFRAGFLTIAGFAVLASLFVWTLPLRRI